MKTKVLLEKLNRPLSDLMTDYEDGGVKIVVKNWLRLRKAIDRDRIIKIENPSGGEDESFDGTAFSVGDVLWLALCAVKGITDGVRELNQLIAFCHYKNDCRKDEDKETRPYNRVEWKHACCELKMDWVLQLRPSEVWRLYIAHFPDNGKVMALDIPEALDVDWEKSKKVFSVLQAKRGQPSV